jgi:selenocysteine-specific elongation factor
MYVVATAGHVDHGKSTLVRALTGIEPDRWAEEQRRGLTIDLGFAWVTTASGADVAFVDVPGHERFLGNMLAGLGPAPVVCLVVAADEGWRAQSAEHRDAIRALGIDRGIVAITRSDLAPGRAPEVAEQVRRELVDTGLRDAPVIAVSARTGDGITELVSALDKVLQATPKPALDSRIRLWIDRAFTIRGAGTVVTGTLAAGTLAVGDRLTVLGANGPVEVSVRGLQQHGASVGMARPVSRIAVNLRGLPADRVHRGDALVSPGTWHLTQMVDVHRMSGPALADLPEEVTAHLGTLAVPARLRPFDGETARVTFERAAPLTVGDRIILRDKGSRQMAGVQAVDVDPPALTRRGAGRRRGEQVAALRANGDVRVEVSRRRAVSRAYLQQLGLRVPESAPDGVSVHGDWWIDEGALATWAETLRNLVTTDRARNPLSAGLSRGAAIDGLRLPDPSLLDLVAATAGVVQQGATLALAETAGDLGTVEHAVAILESRLRKLPFAAPEAHELVELGLDKRSLAAAERVGRLIRLRDDIVLLPSAPALAMRELAKLPEFFTTSEARVALATTRRVAIPLLEHLDERGWTKRLDAGHRTVVRSGGAR